MIDFKRLFVQEFMRIAKRKKEESLAGLWITLKWLSQKIFERCQVNLQFGKLVPLKVHTFTSIITLDNSIDSFDNM